jgi:transketolase
MLVESQKLNPNLFSADVEKEYTRDGYGHGLVEAAEKDERIVACCADLAESTRTHWFKEKFPERYVELGVAEQNLATVASGLAAVGKIPFIASYASFNPGRNNEQIRTTISLNQQPVKIIGAHAGLSVGPDGATHQALEDIALMRVQPNMNVVVGSDMEEVRKAIHAAITIDEPFYIRLGREKTPVITTVDSPFELGKANLLWESKEPAVALVATGSILYNALVAAKELAEDGIETLVLNVHTIKPLDEKAIIDVAKWAGAVVTVEEHQIAGGLGGVVAETLARNYPVPMEFIGVEDQFGQSGNPDELMKHYGLDTPAIKAAVRKAIKRK